MPDNNYFEEIKEITIDKGWYWEGCQYNLKTDFKYDLDMDSLDTVEFVMELELKYKISIPDLDIEAIDTVGELVEYLTEKIK